MDRIETIAAKTLELLGTGRQVAPFSSRYPDLTLADSYRVAVRVRDARRARGEIAVGRKIGFTNTAVWSGYGISGPIWNYVFATTVKELSAICGAFRLAGLAEPRIEPEIALHLARAPEPGMSENELLACVDWIAHAFEVVHSIFPGWRFAAADAVAGYGLHGALLLGERYSIGGDLSGWRGILSNVGIELVCSDGRRVAGHARNVLGGPIRALEFLVGELSRTPGCEPLAAGEIITTGTLTEAMPALPGDTWTTRLSGSRIDGISVTFL